MPTLPEDMTSQPSGGEWRQVVEDQRHYPDCVVCNGGFNQRLYEEKELRRFLVAELELCEELVLPLVGCVC